MEVLPHILYVDDIESNRVLFRETFKKYYDIILAGCAKDALEILSERSIEVLVTDQRMPEMTGTELLEKVAEAHPEIMRFLLSAYTDFKTVVEAVNKGKIHGYINKPLNEDEVKLSIDKAVEIFYLKQRNQEMMTELEEANRLLVNMDGLKTGIIKMISQEIRNPLNRIMGTIHLLKDKVKGEEFAEIVNVFDISVSRLEEFSSMTEQISILKSPSYQLKASVVPLNTVIEFSLIEVNTEMKEKGLAPDLKKASGELIVLGDSHLLVSCLVNLIRNAMDHSGSSGQIHLKTVHKEDRIICEVIDQGKEYVPELVEDLKNHFSAENPGINLNLGIELGLSQMIMEAHGGKILFDIDDEKRGVYRMVFTRRPKDHSPLNQATGIEKT